MSTIGIELDSDQLVLTRGRDFKWTFENLDESTPPQPVDYPAGDLYFELHTFGQQNAVQEIAVVGATGGAYKLKRGDEATVDINYNLARSIKGALEALPSIGVGNVEVSPASLLPIWELSLTLNSSHNEIQNISFVGGANGGNYRLSVGANTTGNIAWGALPSVVQTALTGLASVGAGNCLVTDDGRGGYNVEFTGAKANTNVPQIVGISRGFGFGLTPDGGIFGFGDKASVVTSTVVGGNSKISEPLVAALQQALVSYFGSFKVLSGVAVQLTVLDSLHIEVKITSQKVFTEADLVTFAVDVNKTALEQYFNSQNTWLNTFSAIDVQFFWHSDYTVEFTGALGDRPQPLLEADITNLEGIEGEKKIVIQEKQAGKEEYTRWHFDIGGDTAVLKVESEEADKIQPRTKWQLVFRPDDEDEGGDPVARGLVKVQE